MSGFCGQHHFHDQSCDECRSTARERMADADRLDLIAKLERAVSQAAKVETLAERAMRDSDKKWDHCGCEVWEAEPLDKPIEGEPRCPHSVSADNANHAYINAYQARIEAVDALIKAEAV